MIAMTTRSSIRVNANASASLENKDVRFAIGRRVLVNGLLLHRSSPKSAYFSAGALPQTFVKGGNRVYFPQPVGTQASYDPRGRLPESTSPLQSAPQRSRAGRLILAQQLCPSDTGRTFVTLFWLAYLRVRHWFLYRASSRLGTVRACLGVCLFLSMNLAASAEQNQPSSKTERATHKVKVSNPALGSQIIREGGRLVADYGAYQIYEASLLSPELTSNQALSFRDDYNYIQLNTGALDTRLQETGSVAKLNASTTTGKRLHLVQFPGPVRPEWHRNLTATGARIVSYIPQNTYLIYGDNACLQKVEALGNGATPVQWHGGYEEDYKIHPAARSLNAAGAVQQIDSEEFAVQMVADPDSNPSTLALIEQLELAPIVRQERVLGYLNVVVQLDAANAGQIAARPDVISIQPYYSRRRLSERQNQIVAGNLTGNVPSGPGYLSWLEEKGFRQEQFTASAFVVDLSDSGVDDGTTSPNHFALHVNGQLGAASRVAYSRLEGRANRGSTLLGCDGHGTLNAHIIAGYDDGTVFPHTDSAGYLYGLGTCPFVRIGASVIFDPDNFTNPDYTALLSGAYHDGARISNNSWGGRAGGGRTGGAGYDIDAQTYDALVRDSQPEGAGFSAAGNQEMVVLFAAGNDGPSARTMQSPGTAKNVITIGAGENVQAFGGGDSSGVYDIQADSANDLISFSGRGPCADGRHKPDLTAPGSHVTGGVIQALNAGVNGTADACFTGSGISGGVQSKFFPPNQQFFSASSGTSHSVPCASGACALLRQYFINHLWNPPSPAMTKAYLMNSARYMTGVNARDTLWSDNQGMGEVNLGTAFDGHPRLLRDQLAEDMFTASGQVRKFTGTISDTNAPFRVTLAWTDAPGNTTGNAFNNDLDLTVTISGSNYLGNVFNGPRSIPGGSADSKNNVESVFLPAGLSGDFVITVTAANINSDGVPNNAEPLDQDFALVVSNVNGAALPLLAADRFDLVTESCSPANGNIDAGETVIVGLGLRNVGTLNTTNLVATLESSGGIQSRSVPQSYGALAPGAPAVKRPFSFTVLEACGQTVTATLRLRDGSADLGSVTFSWPVGQFVRKETFHEDFDAVTPPAVPAGWTTTSSGSQAPWMTSPATADSVPNAAFVGDPVGIGLSELVSPPIRIISASSQLSFQNNYNLDADRRRSGVGYDGGVLEIQIGDEPFTDILAAGGAFITNGYTRTISASFGNPLAGRQAWSGRTSGFVLTQLTLPDSAAGNTIVLKWRCATDTSTSATGWFVDSISIVDGAYECCGAPAPGPKIDHVEHTEAGLAVYLSSLEGVNYTLEYKNALEDPAWISLAPAVAGTGNIIVLRDPTAGVRNRFYIIRSN